MHSRIPYQIISEVGEITLLPSKRAQQTGYVRSMNDRKPGEMR